jgi:site-specific DNA recombinase
MKPIDAGLVPEGLIPAVGYIRMSTDDQKDSPERQRGEIVAMAKRDGYHILRWYEDHGITGSGKKKRSDFLQLMTDVTGGTFKAILVDEPSRFSREDLFETMAHWKVLHAAGVTLVSRTKGPQRFDDLAGLLIGIIDQHGSRTEIIKLAERVLSGKKMKARDGVHGANIPFGYDKEIRDESGTLMKRLSCVDRFKRPKSWKSKLVPSSDQTTLDAVRYAFEAVAQGVPMREIAREFNMRGLRTGRNGAFRPVGVRRIVENPVYTGLLRFGHIQRGQFGTNGYDMIVVPDAHPAIVSVEMFDRANRALEVGYKTPGSRGPAGQYPLSTVVVCGHCGRGMIGRTLKWKRNPGKGHRQYFCADATPGFNKCPQGPGISADAIEGLILRLIGERILREERRELLASEMQKLIRSGEEPSVEMGQLQALRLKIERMEQNLGLAEDPDDFRAISNQLKVYREQERKIVARVEARDVRRAPAGIVDLKSANDLKLLRENLHLADRVPLAAALRSLVERVVVRREFIPKKFPGDITLNQCVGTIEFFPVLFSDEPGQPEQKPWVIAFGDADLWPARPYIEIADYVGKAGHAVTTNELARRFDIHHTLALYHAKRAVKVGLIQVDRNGNSFLFSSLPAV